MKSLRKQKRNKGQTALEYALVIGVISVGVIFAGKAIFGHKDSPAHQLMGKVVQKAEGTFAGDNE